MDLISYFQAFAILFVVFDPLGVVPMFHTVVGEISSQRRRKIARQSALASGIILIFFALGGISLLEFLRISIHDFRIAAGAVLLVLSVELVMGKLEPSTRKVDAEDVAVVPIAIPLLAGPGSICTVMYLMYPPFGPAQTMLAIVMNVSIAYLVLSRSDVIFSFLGRNGSRAITRVMGLLVAAIAVMVIREGILGIIEMVK